MLLRSFVCEKISPKISSERCSFSTIIATFATTTSNISTVMSTLFSKKSTREQRIYRVTIAGSLINMFLLVFKFTAGILGGSAAMIADAVHSLSDFMTDIVVLLFVKIGNKPQDEDHDYGPVSYTHLDVYKRQATDRNNYAINSDTSAVRQVLAVDTFSHMNNTRGFLFYNMQELSLRQGPTIGETLGRIPGIQHLSFGPNIGLPVIRSLSGHRVSILSDGLSVSNLSGISPTFGLDIDQDKWTDVEISKHSASVLYGGEAIGGAVNMHSQLVPMQVPTGYVTGTAVLDFGSNSGSRLSFSLNGRIGQHYLWHIGALYHHEKEVSIPGSTKATLANDTSLLESNPALQRMMQRSVVAGRRLNYTLFPYISESGRWNIDPAKQNYDDLFTFQSEEILSGKTIQNTPNPLFVPGQDPQRDRYVQIPHQFVDYGTVEYQKIPNSYRRGNAVEAGMSYVSQHVKVGAGYQYHHSNYGTPLFARTLTEGAITSLHAQYPNAGRPEDYVGVNARNDQHIGRIETELFNVIPYFPTAKLQGLVQYANDQEFLGSEIGNQFKTLRQNTRFELHQQRLKFWTGTTGADFTYQRMEGEGSARYLPNHQSLGWGLFSMQYFDYQFIHAALGYRHEQVYRRCV